jgi:hypothetical protein
VNFEEGFRRIGNVIICIGIILGIITFASGEYVLGISIAVGVIVVGHVLLFVLAYVMKGFMKQSNEEKNQA